MQSLQSLANHPDATKVEFAGQEWDFFICPYGMQIADDAGVDIISEFDNLIKNPNNPTKALGAISKILWVGILPFYPNITLQQVQVNISLADVQATTTVLAQQMNRLTKGSAAVGEAKAPIKGRKK